MCYQIFEHYPSCKHTNVIEGQCSEAGDDPFWCKSACNKYHAESRDNTHAKCGEGRYYCRDQPSGALLDNIHKQLDHAKVLVPYLQAQSKIALNRYSNLNHACDKAKIPRSARIRLKVLVRAVRDWRAKDIALKRAEYLARQLQRRIDFAKHYSVSVIPIAKQQGLPVPSLVFPPDETWTPPQPIAPSYSVPIAPAHDSTRVSTGPATLNAIHQQHLTTQDIKSVIANHSPAEDLGSLASGAWIQQPTLPNLPFGRLRGDRSTAISQLVRKQITHHRQQARLEAAKPKPESRSKRKRKRQDLPGPPSATPSIQQTATPANSPIAEPTSLSNKRRSRRSVKPVNYSEAQDSYGSDDSAKKSTGSSYVDGLESQASTDSIVNNTQAHHQGPIVQQDRNIAHFFDQPSQAGPAVIQLASNQDALHQQSGLSHWQDTSGFNVALNQWSYMPPAALGLLNSTTTIPPMSQSATSQPFPPVLARSFTNAAIPGLDHIVRNGSVTAFAGSPDVGASRNYYVPGNGNTDQSHEHDAGRYDHWCDMAPDLFDDTHPAYDSNPVIDANRSFGNGSHAAVSTTSGFVCQNSPAGAPFSMDGEFDTFVNFDTSAMDGLAHSHDTAMSVLLPVGDNSTKPPADLGSVTHAMERIDSGFADFDDSQFLNTSELTGYH